MSDDHERVNILLVDDRPDQLLVLETILADLGQTLVRARSGREALRFLLQHECAVILLDVNMPDLDGFETAALIRRHPRSRQIPIIFFTASDETDTHISHGYSLGAVDYLHTPVLPELLTAKVSVFVELAQRSAQVQKAASRLEARVQERTAELEALNQALETEAAERRRTEADRARLLAEAQEGVRRRDEFLAMLAHELRNPLASIVSASEIMKLKGLSDPSLEEVRQIIERQSGHLSNLLQDLLDIARITRGKIALSPRRVDMCAIVNEAISSKSEQAHARRHAIDLELPDEPVFVNGDSTRLQQVVVNLLNNAIKFTPPEGRISVAMRAEPERLELRVRDTGIGIAPDQLARIFEPFVQLTRSHNDSSEGLGIGLALVQRLVELHGGSVSVTSAGPSQGSEFRVELPREREPAAEATPHVQAIKQTNGQRVATSRRIVLIEDNRDVCRMLCALLGMNGHEVAESNDGLSGVDTIRRLLPDMALVDLGLPGIDGYEVAARIRSDPECRNVRLIAMSGYGQPEDRRRALSAGFDAHLVKPVSFEQLFHLFVDDDQPTECGAAS